MKHADSLPSPDYSVPEGLFLLRSAGIDLLSKLRRAGRLVYVPNWDTPWPTRFCGTLRKQDASIGIMKIQSRGMLAVNLGPVRPCDGAKV